MSDVTNLRQAKNKIECVGILAEKDLHAGKNQNNGKATIEGYVSIKVDEINQVRFRVQADETKKDGTSNPAYENLTAFNQNASSIAEVGVDNASRVRTASGQLNPYHSQQNNSDVLGYRTSFITVMNGGEEFEPKAEATVELYVQSVVPEMDKDGNETGRAKMKGWMPTYNGIEPVVLIIPEAIADDALNGAIEVGQTMEFYADIINNRVEVIKEIPVRLGPTRIEKSVTYTNELVLTGCSDPYEEGISKEAPYDANAIKLAIEERESRIKEAANKPKNNGNEGQNRPSAAARGRQASW